MSMEKIQLAADYHEDFDLATGKSTGWRGQVKVGDSFYGIITNVGPCNSEIEVIALLQNQIQDSLSSYMGHVLDVARGIRSAVGVPATKSVSVAA